VPGEATAAGGAALGFMGLGRSGQSGPLLYERVDDDDDDDDDEDEAEDGDNDD
jgi:hypothetical protein